MYVVVSTILLPGNLLQTRYDGDTSKCRSEYFFNEKAFTDFMSCFGTFLFVIDYALPIFLFITLYTKTILTIRQRQAKPLSLTCQPSRILDKANIQLTRTAVVVTIVFSICMGWETGTICLAPMVLLRMRKTPGNRFVELFWRLSTAVQTHSFIQRHCQFSEKVWRRLLNSRD